MTCPNSTESGCRCAEHHPGLGHAPAPIVIEVVTAGPRRPAPGARERDAERHVNAARQGCAACGGDPGRCQDGTGPPHFRRLPGCAAWARDGHAVPAKARRAPRQPWEPRAA